MKTKSKTVGKLVRLTKREAEVLVGAAHLAAHVYGEPDCGKCNKAFWSAVEKLDRTFKLEVLTDASDDATVD